MKAQFLLLSLQSSAFPPPPISPPPPAPVGYKLLFYSQLAPLHLFGSPVGTSEAQTGLSFACTGYVFYDMV